MRIMKGHKTVNVTACHALGKLLSSVHQTKEYLPCISTPFIFSNMILELRQTDSCSGFLNDAQNNYCSASFRCNAH